MVNTNNLIVDERSLDTVFQEDFRFKGTILCRKSVMIKGHFQGQITAEENLYLSPTAQVEAEMKAKNLIIQGAYKGNAAVQESFSLHQTAKFLGNVKAASLEVEKGASFNGNVAMNPLPKEGSHA